MQKGFGEPRDLGRHGRGEEQRLPRERHQLADALDVGNEAHVEHTVGLVDDENFDAGEQQLAAIEEVEQAARRRDQHVGAAHDLGFLIAEGDAADQQRDVELVIRAIFGEAFLDLRGEFARRLENERARHARPGAALFETAQHRQREGGRLAGARLGDAENVAPLQERAEWPAPEWASGSCSRTPERLREPFAKGPVRRMSLIILITAHVCGKSACAPAVEEARKMLRKVAVVAATDGLARRRSAAKKRGR